MDDRTKNLVTMVMELNNVKLHDAHRGELEAVNYDHDATVNMLVDNYGLDHLRAETIASAVDSKKEPTVVGLAPKPPKMKYLVGSKWSGRVMVVGLAAITVFVALVFMTRCGKDNAKNAATSVHQTDTATVKSDDANTDLKEMKSDIETLKKDHKAIRAVVDALKTDDTATQANVVTLQADVSTLQTNMTTLTESVDKLADKVLGTKHRLKRLERKLDAHIADEEAIDMPAEDAPAPASGTTTLVIQKVEVNDN